MRYAIVNGESREAERGLSGECRGCGSPMLARCGTVRVNHWAHKGKLQCDPWLKEMTEWHRRWQDCFPKPWQEYRFVSDKGEMHIADVKTEFDWVLEFQHSPMKPDERKSRNDFYKKLVWVVDGLRLKRDHSQFKDSLREVGSFNSSPAIRRIFSVFSYEGALLRDWGNSAAPVFFDFGEEHVLWCLLPSGSNQNAYVIEFSRAYFIAFHKGDSTKADHFSVILKNMITSTAELTRPKQVQKVQIRQPDIMDTIGFQRQMARNNQPRRRFRF